ncbi:26S proteasome complex subunit [Schaereria dolodes]|nr:26S proteasome complex subunit [Schaereria dolodes]
MSASAEGGASTTKAVVSDQPPSDSSKDQQKPAAALEEDDEFEDFPVEGVYPLQGRDWPQEDAEVPGGNTHLWEESWDDDDTSEDFSKQLK